MSRLLSLTYLSLVAVLSYSSHSKEPSATSYELSPFAAQAPLLICDQIPGLGPELKAMCIDRSVEFVYASEGFDLGIRECRNLFQRDRWNCSTRGDVHENGLLGVVMARVSKEAAFMFAMASAGIVYKVADACWRGELPRCGCDNSLLSESQRPMSPLLYPKDYQVKLQWDCEINVSFGMKVAREFMNSWRNKRDAEGLMNRHNANVGRLAVRSNLELHCRCFGLSGACTSKVCWRLLPPNLKKIGHWLKSKYNNALHAKPYYKPRLNGLPQFLVREGTVDRDLPRDNLVYLLPSPNYCERDALTGSLGTRGRECSLTSNGSDNCLLLCCGRGYDTFVVERTYRCRCKFKWCCQVECETCQNATETYTCK